MASVAVEKLYSFEDYRFKRSEYAALGITEYWIVDPLEAQVSVLLLNEGLYEQAVFAGDQAIVSQIFPNLQLTVGQILREGGETA